MLLTSADNKYTIEVIMNYGEVLKAIRISKNVGLREMSRRLKKCASYLSRCENNQLTYELSEDLILEYCHILGVENYQYLFQARRFPSEISNAILADKDFFDFICMASKLEISPELWQSMRSTLESFATKKE